MENYRQMKKIERIITICAFAFIVVFSVAIFSFFKLSSLRRQNAQFDEQYLALSSKEQVLQSDIEKMQQDDYIEDKAREELDMIKEDETLYVYE